MTNKGVEKGGGAADSAAMMFVCANDGADACKDKQQMVIRSAIFRSIVCIASPLIVYRRILESYTMLIYELQHVF
jgi:hypothetical protein